MSHLEEGTLHALLDGEIDSSELSEVQAHLAACAECRTRLEQERLLMTEALDLVQMIEVPENDAVLAPAAPAAATIKSIQPERAPRGNWTRGLAWAATVVGAVGLGYAARGVVNPSGTAPLTVTDSAQPVGSNLATGPTDTVPAEAQADAAKATPAPSPKPATLTSNQPRARIDTASRLDEMRPAPTAAPPAPAPERNATGGASARDARELAARAEAPALAQAKLVAPVEELTFPDALRRLDGTIRLIPGLIPTRLEAQGTEVRVVYATAQGELILRQEVVNGRLVFRLSGPPGFPADSLEKLRARVRE